MNSLLFTIAKNDNQWLDEWVRYHLAIGFSHILIYDNNDGMDDYPMSDYIIEQCTTKNISVVNKRNLRLDYNLEFNNIDIEYDYAIMLSPDEFFSFKDSNMTLDLFLNDKKYGMFVNVVPFDVIGDNEKINIKKYKSYFPKYFKKNGCNKIEKTHEVFIKKILSIT